MTIVQIHCLMDVDYYNEIVISSKEIIRDHIVVEQTKTGEYAINIKLSRIYLLGVL